MTPLRIFAVLFGLMAVSNFVKPLELASDHGFVFMGNRLSGPPNVIAALSFAGFLAAYAEALWNRRPRALPMVMAYAGYVAVNLALFTMRNPEMASESALFGIVYTTIAIGVSLGAVIVCRREGLGEGQPDSDAMLKCFAILFGLMAVSNTLKPFVYGETTGFVLFGARQTGTANVVAALTFAAFLVAYAQAIWAEKKRALPMSMLYAGYVVVNLVLWTFRKPEGTETPLLFGIGYLIIAIGVSSGAAATVYRVRERLT